MAQAMVLEDTDISIDAFFETPAGRKALSCIQCGICAGTCPYGSVMTNTPRKLINKLRAGLIDEVLASDDLLTCVTCYACWAKCPREIQLTDVLLPLVKEQVFLNLPEVPTELQSALESTLRYGNPMGESPRKRAAWVETSEVEVPIMRDIKRPVDVLWIVECYASYYPRGQDNARATAKVLNTLGVDFAILGNEEKCAGECARLAGEAGLFDKLRDDNMKILGKYEYDRIVTSDPHAFDAFRFLYPPLGLSVPVEQTTPFVARHLEQLKPKLTKELNYKVTYHDSCVLGRHNGYYDEPRLILESIPGVEIVEMAHTGINAICCGGGGGGMWLDAFYKTKGYERLSDRRVEEAAATGADVLAVSCPYEVPRFEDSAKVLGCDDRLAVKDIMEIVAEALED